MFNVINIILTFVCFSYWQYCRQILSVYANVDEPCGGQVLSLITTNLYYERRVVIFATYGQCGLPTVLFITFCVLRRDLSSILVQNKNNHLACADGAPGTPRKTTQRQNCVYCLGRPILPYHRPIFPLYVENIWIQT